MRYLGGKSRLCYSIAKHLGSHGKSVLYEPFCGGCSVTAEAARYFEKIYASDAHYDLIILWKALMDGWIPPLETISETEYRQLKYSKSSPRRSFYGFAQSFGGEFFHTYARSKKNYDFVRGAHRSCLTKVSKMKGKVKFRWVDYLFVEPKDAVVYCDPPYFNTRKYQMGIDVKQFWSKMVEWSKDNIVYVSEYTIPEDVNVEIVENRLSRITACDFKTVKDKEEYLLRVR